MTNNGFLLSRRGAVQTLAAGAATLALKDTFTSPAFAAAAMPAASGHNPGAHWEKYAKPQDAGFTSDLTNILEMLYPAPTTSFMIVRGGKIALSYGDLGQISYLASSRKSIMSALYGKYVANGTIKLSTTIGQLGVDEDDGLMPIEKTATVRDLLMASSGIYHPPGSPGSGPNTPARGSMKPGTHFYYNNWDFNVVGAAFAKMTGKTVFQAFAEDLAGPLEMEDFDPARQHMLGFDPPHSRYPAYVFFLSGRDMARLGLCMINGGKWNGKEIVPAAWVKESTAVHVKATGDGGTGNKDMGYGYLWWIPTEGRKTPEWANSYAAQGNYGQYIFCLPALDLVVVHRRAVTDEFAIARNVGHTNANPAGGEIAIMPVIDAVVATLKA